MPVIFTVTHIVDSHVSIFLSNVSSRDMIVGYWRHNGDPAGPVRLFWRVFRDPTENWGAESFWRRGRGRDESIICGSRRCIATVTLHMYTSPERNTVWTQNIAIYPMCIYTKELSRFTKCIKLLKKVAQTHIRPRSWIVKGRENGSWCQNGTCFIFKINSKRGVKTSLSLEKGVSTYMPTCL